MFSDTEIYHEKEGNNFHIPGLWRIDAHYSFDNANKKYFLTKNGDNYDYSVSSNETRTIENKCSNQKISFTHLCGANGHNIGTGDFPITDPSKLIIACDDPEKCFYNDRTQDSFCCIDRYPCKIQISKYMDNDLITMEKYPLIHMECPTGAPMTIHTNDEQTFYIIVAYPDSEGSPESVFLYQDNKFEFLCELEFPKYIAFNSAVNSLDIFSRDYVNGEMDTEYIRNLIKFERIKTQ